MAKNLAKNGKIKIKQIKSLRGCTDSQRATVAGLGLSHVNEERVLENTSSVRGMIKKVLHLVRVEEELR